MSNENKNDDLDKEPIDQDAVIGITLISDVDVVGVMDFETLNSVVVRFPIRVVFGETGLFIKPFCPVMENDSVEFQKQHIITMFDVNESFKGHYLSAVNGTNAESSKPAKNLH